MSNGVTMRSSVGFGTMRAKRPEAVNVGRGDDEAVGGREGESSLSSFLTAIRNQISDYFTYSKEAVERAEKPEEEDTKDAGFPHSRRCTTSSDYLKLNCSKCGTPNGFDMSDKSSIWHKAAEELYGREMLERRRSGTRRGCDLEPSVCERRSRSGCGPSHAARNDYRNGDPRRNRRGAPKRSGEPIDSSRRTDPRTDLNRLSESNGCKKMPVEPRRSGSRVAVKETYPDDSRQNGEPVRLDEPQDVDGCRTTGTRSPDKIMDRSKLEWKSLSDQQVLQFYKKYQIRTNKRIMNGKDGYRLKLHHLFSLDNQDGVQTEHAKHLASKSENDISNIVAKYNRYATKERKTTQKNDFTDARADEDMRAKNKEKVTVGATLEDIALLSKYSALNVNDGYRMSLTCSPAFMRRNKKCDQECGLLYPNKRIPMFIKCEDISNECKKKDPSATNVPMVLIDPEGMYEVMDEKKQKKKKKRKCSKKKKSSVTTEECKSESTPNTESCCPSEDSNSATAETSVDMCSLCANPPDKCTCDKTTPSASANTESCETASPPPLKLCAHKPESKCKKAYCKRCGKGSRGTSKKSCLDDGIKITIGENNIGCCEQTKYMFCCCCRPDCSFKDSLKQMFCISLPTSASSDTKCCFRRNDYAKTCTFFFNKSGK